MSDQEVFCPLTKELCKEAKCGWWNADFTACAILIISMTYQERALFLLHKQRANLRIERLTRD
jgi:hypothetical protein